MILDAGCEFPQTASRFLPTFREAAKGGAVRVPQCDGRLAGKVGTPALGHFGLEHSGCRTRCRQCAGAGRSPVPDLVGQAAEAKLDASMTMECKVALPAAIVGYWS